MKNHITEECHSSEKVISQNSFDVSAEEFYEELEYYEYSTAV